MFVQTISVKLSMVMHHYEPEYHVEILFCCFQGLSHNRFYKIFRNTETFATQINLQYTITRQGKILLLLLRVWNSGCGLGDCGPDCCHSWPSWYLRQGSVPVPIKKMWKEHCFCNEYTCLLNLLVNGLSVWL